MSCCGSIEVPVTNEERFIFPYIDISQSFVFKYYDPQASHRRLSKKKLEEFFATLHSNTSPELAALNKVARPVFIAFIFLVLLIIGGGVCLFFSQQKQEQEEAYVKAGLAFIVASIIQYGIIFGIVTCRERSLIRRCRKKILDQITGTKEFYAEKGMRWAIPNGFPYWIELWFDFKKNESAVAIRVGGDATDRLSSPVTKSLLSLANPPDENPSTFRGAEGKSTAGDVESKTLLSINSLKKQDVDKNLLHPDYGHQQQNKELLKV